MTLLEKIKADYERKLAERWTVEGERRRLRIDTLPDIGIPISAQSQASQFKFSNFARRDWGWGKAENTREICGND